MGWMLSRKKHSHAVTALAILACGGCTTVGPDYEQPEVRLNPAWLDAELELYDAEPADLVDWWRRFEDPVLDGLIEAAYENSYTLEIAALRIQESSAQLAIANGNRFPQTQVATAWHRRYRRHQGDVCHCWSLRCPLLFLSSLLGKPKPS